MPAKDIFHDAVKNGLLKEGWTITADPLFIQFGEVDIYIDIGADKLIAAERPGQQIAVEVKSFTQTSLIYAFHLAVGQYINYRQALHETAPARTLYLAVPEDVYESFFSRRLIQLVIENSQIHLLVYDNVQEVIVKWLS